MLALFVGIGGYAEFFQQAGQGAFHSAGHYSQVFDATAFGQVQKLKLTNRLGSFSFERRDPLWEMVSPRHIEARRGPIEDILQRIKSLTAIFVYEKDPINLSNFSLDSPSLSVEVQNAQGQAISLDFGLINPMDNSTYVTRSDSQVIFQVGPGRDRLESLGLAHFIEPKVVSLSVEDIDNLAIYREKKKGPQLKILRSGDGWRSSTGRILDRDAIQKYLGQLAQLSSFMILDKMEGQLQGAVEEYLQAPIYRVTIGQRNGEKITFEVSRPVAFLPNLNLEKKKNVLLRASHKRYVYVIPKSSLAHFQKTQYSFKGLGLKKIFY